MERAVVRERRSAPGGDTRGLVSASSSSTDFLGRRAELEAFERAVEVARLGRSEVFLVGGDAGIGKSTLVLEGARRGGVEIVCGRCVPMGGELEYIDGGTLAHAMAGRQTL